MSTHVSSSVLIGPSVTSPVLLGVVDTGALKSASVPESVIGQGAGKVQNPCVYCRSNGKAHRACKRLPTCTSMCSISGRPLRAPNPSAKRKNDADDGEQPNAGIDVEAMQASVALFAGLRESECTETRSIAPKVQCPRCHRSFKATRDGSMRRHGCQGGEGEGEAMPAYPSGACTFMSNDGGGREGGGVEGRVATPNPVAGLEAQKVACPKCQKRYMTNSDGSIRKHTCLGEHDMPAGCGVAMPIVRPTPDATE